MSALEFLDTNVLVYAYDPSEPRKRQIAQNLVRGAVAGGSGASRQVHWEFAGRLPFKLKPAGQTEDGTTLPNTLAPLKHHPGDGAALLCAVRAHTGFGI